MRIMETAPGEFYVVGSGLTATFIRDADVDSGIAGIESVEQVARVSGVWQVEKRLNGDQTNQGRQTATQSSSAADIYRVRLYSISTEPGQ